MNSSKNIITLLAFLSLVSAVCISACKKSDNDDTDPLSTDAFLYQRALETSGFTWYKNSDALLQSSSLSGHAEDFLRTRYNDTAATKLASDGTVMSGITFPEGSLIVKELYTNNTDISTYAILYKKSNHTDADADGWVWGYLNADGSVKSAASNKGSSCRGCHGQSGSIDFTLMNKAYP